MRVEEAQDGGQGTGASGPGRGERDRVHTCQAAEGQGPGGRVCWWPQSQTHLECCEAHPARPGAETPPCKWDMKARESVAFLSSCLPAVPVLTGLLHRATCSAVPRTPLQAGPCFPSTSPTQLHGPFQNWNGRNSLGAEDCGTLPHIAPSWTPHSILAQTPTCPSHLQSLRFAPGLEPGSLVHQRR